MTVTLEKLGGDTRNSFIEKLKESFDAFVEENPGTPEGPVISRGEIEASLNRPGSEAYWALRDGQRVGGIVLTIDAKRARGDIELLFVVNGLKGKSVGADIVAAAEGRYPSVKTWELYTPYVETRNIHFYVNKCGYKIVEFFNPKHPLVMPESEGGDGSSSGELFFRFEKKMDENEVTS